MPNVGPSDGCRSVTTARRSMCLKPSASPTAIVVLPSPSGVGLVAVTSTYFALGGPIWSIASSEIFAISRP